MRLGGNSEIRSPMQRTQPEMCTGASALELEATLYRIAGLSSFDERYCASARWHVGPFGPSDPCGWIMAGSNNSSKTVGKAGKPGRGGRETALFLHKI
jgi:hypothetical protein